MTPMKDILRSRISEDTLNKRKATVFGFCTTLIEEEEDHKPGHLSNEPQIFWLILFFVHSPVSMTSFTRKQYPNAVICA